MALDDFQSRFRHESEYFLLLQGNQSVSWRNSEAVRIYGHRSIICCRRGDREKVSGLVSNERNQFLEFRRRLRPEIWAAVSSSGPRTIKDLLVRAQDLNLLRKREKGRGENVFSLTTSRPPRAVCSASATPAAVNVVSPPPWWGRFTGYGGPKNEIFCSTTWPGGTWRPSVGQERPASSR